MKNRKRFIAAAAAILLLICTGTAEAAPLVPYDTYNYDYWGNIVYTPAAYIPDKEITGVSLGIGSFSSPQDFYAGKENFYIADTENNRIIVLDKSFQFIKIIDSFIKDGSGEVFLKPTGIAEGDDGKLYVADSGNGRIVVLNRQGDFIKQISNPKSEILAEDFIFTPLKVTVDYANRVYCIAQNMYQGIMAFDEDGNFTGFTGTINVTLSPYEIFWRRFSTKEQRSRQALFIPTEFTGMDIDTEGFLYASNVDSNGRKSARLLNAKGQDVSLVNKRATLSGDLYWRVWGDYSGASRITDIAVQGKGIFSIMDSQRGRIFTYDQEGNLLYIFGGLGTQKGTFKVPVAIEAMDGKILVLDSQRNAILTFQPTEYGRFINEAVGLRYDGDETKAVEKWKDVLKLDSNFELAYIGIGKAYLSAGENKLAMKAFRMGMDKEYYSIAFKRYRNELLKANLNYLLTGGVLLIAAGTVFTQIRKRRRRVHV